MRRSKDKPIKKRDSGRGHDGKSIWKNHPWFYRKNGEWVMLFVVNGAGELMPISCRKTKLKERKWVDVTQLYYKGKPVTEEEAYSIARSCKPQTTNRKPRRRRKSHASEKENRISEAKCRAKKKTPSRRPRRKRQRKGHTV